MHCRRRTIGSASLVAGALLFGVVCPGQSAIHGSTQWAVEEGGVIYAIRDRNLYRIDSDNRTVTHVPLPAEIDGSLLREVGVSEGFLWIATDSSIANADTRHLDWVVYGPEGGSPLPGYAGMAFEGGVVWVAGASALGRFDYYAERWTRYSIPLDTVTDIASFNRQIWLAGGGAVVRFDPEYEKTRLYRCGTELPIPAATWLHRFGDELWALGPGGAARYVAATESWQAVACPARDPSQVVVQGSLVWIIGAGKVSVYDLESRSCRSPVWMDRVRGDILDGTVHEGRVYLATDEMLAIYLPSGNPAELKGDLRFPGEVDGLIRPPRRIVSTGARLIGEGDDGFATFLPAEDQWWVSVAESRARPRHVSAIRLGDGLELGVVSPPIVITGSYTYLLQGARTSGDWDVSDRHRVRLSGRRGPASAFFDNTDQLLGDRWGAQYKGAPDATLREAGAGWGTVDGELMDLTGHPGYRGGRVWAEHGPRSPQRGRRPLQARVWAGQRTTGHAEEHFGGGLPSYQLAHGNIVIGTARVFLDDQALDEGSFTLDHRSGSFFLSFAERDLVTEDSTIRVSYDYWLPRDQEKAAVACPQLMLNRGELWTLSLGSLLEREEGSSRSLLSGALRYRSAPDAPRSLWGEGEVLADPESGALGSRGLISLASHRLQVQVSGTALPDTIQTDGRTMTEYGPLQRELATSGRLALWDELPASWRLAWRRAGDHHGTEGGGRIVWARPGIPALSLDFASRRWEVDTLDTSWRKVELGGEYEPRALIGFDKARAQVLLRQSSDLEGERSTRFRSGLSRLHLRPAGVLDLSLLAWGTRSDDMTSGSPARLSGRASGLLTATSTPVSGISLYLRSDGDMASSDYREATKDVALARSLLASATVRPGMFPVEMEGSYSRTLFDSLDDIDRSHGLAGVLGDVGDSCTTLQQRGASIGGGPLLFLPAQSTLRLRASRMEKTSIDAGGTFSSSTQETYLMALDILPLSASRWFAEGTGTVTQGGGGDIDTWGIYARWERRWTPLFLSRVAFSGTRSRGTSDTWSWAPSLYAQMEPARGLEVRGDLGAGRRKSGSEETFVRGACRVDLRVLSAFLLRAEVRPEVAFLESGTTRSSLAVHLRAGATL